MKRITLVACFDAVSCQRIDTAVASCPGPLCKVPFNIPDRIRNDTLPYHLTLSAWDADQAATIIPQLPTLATAPLHGDYQFAVMDSTIKGNILFLDPCHAAPIRALQQRAYALLPTAKYDPATYRLHTTVNINADKAVNLALAQQLRGTVLPLTIDRVCLFAIYPAKLLAEVKFKGANHD